jgi:hypothetical protein
MGSMLVICDPTAFPIICHRVDPLLKKSASKKSRTRLVSFMDYDLGYFDLETRVLEPPGGRSP